MRYEDGCIFQFQRFPVTEGWEFCQERGGKLAAKVLGKLFLFTITSLFNTKHNHASTNADSPTLSGAYFPEIFYLFWSIRSQHPPPVTPVYIFWLKDSYPMSYEILWRWYDSGGPNNNTMKNVKCVFNWLTLGGKSSPTLSHIETNGHLVKVKLP